MPTPRSFWPNDGGDLYAETPAHLHDGQWLIEPWNAFSSLMIVLPGLYFLYRLRGQLKQQALLALCAPILILGGLGSTFFHGFRSSPFFLIMDVFPTLAVFVMMITYIWYKVLRSWLLAILVLSLAFGVSYLAFTYLPAGTQINVSYFIRGTAFFLPLLILLFRTQFTRSWLMFSGLASFVAALVFRYYDKAMVPVLPMGSHFLWHAFTGIGGILIAEYLITIGSRLRMAEIPEMDGRA